MADKIKSIWDLKILNLMQKAGELTAHEREYQAFADPNSKYYQYTKPYLDKYNLKYSAGNGTYGSGTMASMTNSIGGSADKKRQAYLEFMRDYNLADDMHNTQGDEYYRIGSGYRRGLLESQNGIGPVIEEIAATRAAGASYSKELQQAQAKAKAEAEALAKKTREEQFKKNMEELSVQMMESAQNRAQQQTTYSTEDALIAGRRRALRQQNEKHTGGSLGVKNLGVLGTMGYGGSLGSGLY